MEPRAFTTTLTGNKSEQMQFELSHSKIGMKVECNEDGERYLVETQDSWQLGYLPKKISNEIEMMDAARYNEQHNMTLWRYTNCKVQLEEWKRRTEIRFLK